MTVQPSMLELLDSAEAASSEQNRLALIDQIRDRAELDEGLGGPDLLRSARLLVLSGDLNDLPAIATLAKRAHAETVEGAGLVFAEAMDKMSLYRGLPQPYGTVMVEHQGDIVQPPVDESVTDEERAELGVAPREASRAHCIEMSRRLATERAATPGVLPAGHRYCRVWNDPDPAELRTRLQAEGVPAWADGDVITLVCESDVPVTAAPVFPISSWDAGDGLQVLSLRVERLEEAVITYTFTPLMSQGNMRFARGSHDGRFRGDAAPPELPSNDPLHGSLLEHSVDSPALGAARAVSVYLPAEHTPGEDIPVVFATDGNMFAPYARRLDAAIEAGNCPRVVVVAAHAAPMNQVEGNVRALEYLRGFDEARFAAHQRFFIVELAAWAEKELGVARQPPRRGLFGCSDGGGHAMTTALLNPTKFAHVFAYSTGTPPDPSMMTGEWDNTTSPFVHLCAGTLEDGFFQATSGWAAYLDAVGARYYFTERVCGHDLIQWCEEFPRAIARAWG